MTNQLREPWPNLKPPKGQLRLPGPNLFANLKGFSFLAKRQIHDCKGPLEDSVDSSRATIVCQSNRARLFITGAIWDCQTRLVVDLVEIARARGIVSSWAKLRLTGVGMHLVEIARWGHALC